MNYSKKPYFSHLLLLVTALLISSCANLAEILQQVNIVQPDVKVSGSKLTGLSFDKADLVFDIRVSNPNALGIEMAGFDYELLLNDGSFLKGSQNNPIKIAANNSSTFQIPLSLVFKDVYKTYQNLKQLDSLNYELKTGLSFNLPMLGATRIPLSKEGSLPNLKMPKINLHSLKLQKLSFTGADLLLQIKLDNPNSWSVDLNKLNYSFAVNGAEWLTGQGKQAVKLKAKDKATVSIPLSVNFLEMGRAAYTIISGDAKIDYRLKGGADLQSSISLLGKFQLPFDKSGQIKITK